MQEEEKGKERKNKNLLHLLSPYIEIVTAWNSSKFNKYFSASHIFFENVTDLSINTCITEMSVKLTKLGILSKS